jgi:hypothetical protein
MNDWQPAVRGSGLPLALKLEAIRFGDATPTSIRLSYSGR